MINVVVTITNVVKAATALEHGLYKGPHERRALLDLLITKRSGQLFRIASALTPADARRVLKKCTDLASYEITYLLAAFPDTKEYHRIRLSLITRLLKRPSEQLMDERVTLNDPHDDDVSQWWPIYALKSESEKGELIGVLINREQRVHLGELLLRQRKIYDQLEQEWSTAPFLSPAETQSVKAILSGLQI